VDGLAITNRDGLELDHGYREVQFEFTATSYTAPERIRFRRQLIGFDEDWVETGGSRTAIYPRLTPGRYVFRFTACNADGVWNDEPVSLAFVVTPAFWQTLWFRLAALIAFGGCVAALVRHRYVQKMRRKLLQLEQANAVEQERMRIARDIHDDLGARLTQMAFLSEMAAGEVTGNSRIQQHLETLARSARQSTRSLEEIVWAVNPRRDSLQHLVDYLTHHANEFFRTTPIRCRQDLPLMLPEVTVSAAVRHHLFLACKEALNNTHKHSQATEVWLRLTADNSRLTVVIEDNGSGFEPRAGESTGNGLANLQTRMAAIGGQCSVESEPGRGTRVRLTLDLSAPSGTSSKRLGWGAKVPGNPPPSP
jgi:signal transduction histidine kinase